jgi:iron complex transport system ATP-binding protein
MDEPTAHLDLSNQDRLLAIIRDLAAKGVTLVLTTHDPNLAASVAGLIVLMRDGQVLAAGPPAATLTAEKLSATYGVRVRVLEVDHQRVSLLGSSANGAPASASRPA